MKTIKILFFTSMVVLFAACNSKTNNESSTKSDSKDSVQMSSKQAVVMIYNFHLTNRCPTCRAIEAGARKTLDTYFKTEVKEGRIKFFVLNVDDKANDKISEKYQAAGSGLFVTRFFQGKELTKDFTEDGFSYARNDEAKFVEMLKKQISEYLK
ncbi:MAG: nitrophenyl compound nitroreductase subunit ArsF family protein [Bacteroidales bacterium]